MARRRRRYYTNYEVPTRPVPAPVQVQPLYPDYAQLLSVVPEPPTVSYVPFDVPMVIDGEADYVRLNTLKDTLLCSTRKDARVQFNVIDQAFPTPPSVTYPEPPARPPILEQPEPHLPSPPERHQFLPKRWSIEDRVPFLYSIRCVLLDEQIGRKLRKAREEHNKAYAAADAEYERVKKQNAQAKEHWRQYEAAAAQWKLLNDRCRPLNVTRLASWDKANREFLSLKAADTARLARLKETYFQNDPVAIATHAQLVLLRSPYPAVFPKSVQAAYDGESRIVVIDYQLPDIESISIVKPSTKKGEGHVLVPVNATERRQASDDLLFMIMLRSAREVVLADEINALTAIVVNGWMSFKDKATGQQRSEYIMSLHATADQIRAIDFANVDPKTCFKSLKGVSAPRPTQCIPIAPILKFDKDRRIIAAREVIDGLAAESNLAVMAWDDFEHLIRELFEREFAHNGAEVRVTQASHDRGVDALVFDPDPVRGGKYVIQAKRYTMTVDVSSVRDLYGTVLNEGANRGILVTTSAFGPDAYEFAKDKPITLIDGARLLHMLQKHGYNFRIDLKEARRLLANEARTASN